MGVGSGLYMYDVVVKRSRSLSHFLMSSYTELGLVSRVLPNYTTFLSVSQYFVYPFT